MLDILFASNARVKVLSLLLLEQDKSFYQRRIQLRTGLAVRGVQREMERLTALGLVDRSVDGNRVYYSINTSFPLLPELTGLVRKTEGLRQSLEDAFAPDEAILWAYMLQPALSGGGRIDRDEPELVICTSYDAARIETLVKAKRLEFGHSLRYRTVDPDSEEGGNPSPRKGPTVLWLKKRDKSG